MLYFSSCTTEKVWGGLSCPTHEMQSFPANDRCGLRCEFPTRAAETLRDTPDETCLRRRSNRWKSGNVTFQDWTYCAFFLIPTRVQDVLRSWLILFSCKYAYLFLPAMLCFSCIVCERVCFINSICLRVMLCMFFFGFCLFFMPYQFFSHFILLAIPRSGARKVSSLRRSYVLRWCPKRGLSCFWWLRQLRPAEPRSAYVCHRLCDIERIDKAD